MIELARSISETPARPQAIQAGFNAIIAIPHHAPPPMSPRRQVELKGEQVRADSVSKDINPPK